ncbi:hypothetical protein [Desulfosediminicola ganghwensis]|uniref:hypothetical protein n=1 Tax=Desulfosediminicola ganghwensis TaxID=2569540 RepID=UPI001E5F52BE|nr:hypothetical protein [Desulfosediminicola ganghwensis]
MKTNPPAPEDNDIVDGMARIGQIEMALFLKKQKTTNGWLCFTKRVGNFDTDYLLRAMANLLGPGWNRPADAVYPLSQKMVMATSMTAPDTTMSSTLKRANFPLLMVSGRSQCMTRISSWPRTR